MTEKLTGELLVERMTEKERGIAARVESVLPALRAGAEKADASGEFPFENIALLQRRPSCSSTTRTNTAAGL